MADLSTKYLGLNLKNPVIAASSGLTKNLHQIQELENRGVGAVVLKSLFEEEIEVELKKQQKLMMTPSTIYPEIFDAFSFEDMEDSVSKYLFLIEDAKKTVSVPIIASVNCVSSHEWTGFATRLQNAGADALELNMFILPSDFSRSSEDNENIYFDVINKVKNVVNIPISLKISYYFSNLGSMIKRLSETGIDGLVLFNRFFSPDIDINIMQIIPSNIYSSPTDITISLRWIAIMANRVKCSLAASTGINDGEAVVKQLLAGADVVQVASTLYKNGYNTITEMVKFLNDWMDKHNYSTIDDFRGKMSKASTTNPAAYERVQFMQHFAGIGM
jgi:dihydroorotate dehydrogenase (fumarate)